MTQFINILISALYAMLIQNLIFSAAYGISETIKIAKKPRHLFMCTASVAYFSVFAVIGSYFINKLSFIAVLPETAVYLVYAIIIGVVYLISGYFCVHFLKANKKFMNSLGMCAFNSLVLSVPVLSLKTGNDLFEGIGLAVGAAFAFLIAILLINAGIRHIAQNKNIPKVFQGTPALLIYVGILSLALSSLSGESLFV